MKYSTAAVNESYICQLSFAASYTRPDSSLQLLWNKALLHCKRKLHMPAKLHIRLPGLTTAGSFYEIKRCGCKRKLHMAAKLRLQLPGLTTAAWKLTWIKRCCGKIKATYICQLSCATSYLAWLPSSSCDRTARAVRKAVPDSLIIILFKTADRWV